MRKNLKNIIDKSVIDKNKRVSNRSSSVNIRELLKINKSANSRYEFQFNKNIFPNSKRSNSRFDFHLNEMLPKSKRSNSRFDFHLNEMLPKSKRSQVTIFIIIAILIVVGIGLYFVLRGNIFPTTIPSELDPVYEYYLSCIQGETENGISILGTQGGYIKNLEFLAGTEYMPFSSELSFFGIGVPYWYYISGNGIEKEQIPSKEKMQEQLNDYLEENLNCNFQNFKEQGFIIDFEEVEVNSFIRDNSVEVDVKQNLVITNGEVTWSKNSHSVSVNSMLGKFYGLAKKIYLNNKENMFLENYAVDILRLYAPVDGSEIGCSPKIWFVEKIRADLIDAVAVNIPSIKLKGQYYVNADKYFVQDIGSDIDTDINFMYLSDWPMKMEVWPSEDGLLKAEPVGLQEGMGMLGFCYTPYHFVYDFAFPVMIQMYSGSEMFQFPVVVYIEKNNPREALDVEGLPDVVPQLCEHKNTQIIVYTYNTNLEPVESEIKFKCFDTQCRIGKTEVKGSDAALAVNFPQCANGFILAKAEGYKTKKYQISTVQEGVANIVLDREYELELEVQKGGQKLDNDYSVITFTKGDEITTISYPEMNTIKLTEGQYEIKAYVYTDSTINLQGRTIEECIDVPKAGVLGVFGMTEEKCFTMEVPDQIVSFAVSGGGKQNYYVAESELANADKLIINTNNFGVPNTVEKLQENYDSVEINGLNIWFE